MSKSPLGGPEGPATAASNVIPFPTAGDGAIETCSRPLTAQTYQVLGSLEFSEWYLLYCLSRAAGRRAR